MDQFRQTFKDEANEHLAELESSLLELEEAPDDLELVGRVFRSMHTIKGSGAMFGFDDIARFTHEVETVFDLVRTGQLTVTGDLVNLSLKARDRIKAMLDADGTDQDSAASEKLIAAFRLLAERGEPAGRCPDADSEAEPEAECGDTITYRIRFKPLPGIFKSGMNPVALLNELQELGRCTVVAQTSEVPVLAAIDPENCYLFWDVVLTTPLGVDAIRDVFIFVEDECDLSVTVIDASDGLDQDEDYKKLGDILVERGDLTPEDMLNVLAVRKRFGELAVEAGVATGDQIASALAEQQHVRAVRQERASDDATSNIRVPASRLDVLINLVGELVTVQARFTQTALQRDDEELLAIAEEVERLTVELRDNTLNIRMLPIGSTFSKFKRLVRDLSQELGKQIEMTTEGAETELDKTVIEKLNDPLVHLIRNCIDHGIELPAIREQQGKPRHGTVHLSAAHSGDSVQITIRDDGAGLDRDAIRAKATERELISATAELSEQEIFSQIFAAGFSTAKQVTSVSGRGVGMDVVKRAIDALRGSIAISSERGKGTTIAVKIPLTLAIIESLLVQVGNDRFVLPLSQVSECIELTREDIEGAHGRNLVNVRDRIVPYIPLRERFGISGPVPDLQQIVIITIEGRQVGFAIDQVIGEHQTVIKSLGRYYQNVQGVSGATILGDGTVALILDIPVLIQLAGAFEHDEQRKHC
ncbi:MAG: chemotaxis protein CheA [Geobacteraceae bacterium GWC2_53_11]|nr:MAG: chemotaxis protein CheA [Geobacteraceae bacterium GWC2_53_11]